MNKSKKATVKENYVYNVIFQIFALVTIFITTPYITRVLGAEGLGIYSYTYSIVTYFILIGSLGISLYGQREIAYYQDDIEKRSKSFFEVFILKLILLLIAVLFFYIFFCIKGDYKLYYKILILELIGNGIDILWLYQGMEDFKKVVIRNILIRTFCIALIFIFVKESNDLWKYVLVSSLATFLGNISLWVRIKEYIKFSEIKKINMAKHIKPILVLFIPQIAIQIYTVLDKTMIGAITHNMSYVGVYQKTQEIVKLGMTIVTSFGAVIFPRIANNFKKQNGEKIEECIEESFIFVWLIGLPLVFGLMACANNFVPWYLGKEFLEAKGLLMTFSVIMLVIGLNNVVGMQYLIATGKQKIFSIAVVIGAITNVIGNYFLIKLFNNYGAVISSIISEMIILIIEFVYMKKVIKGHMNIRLGLKCLLCSLIMFAIVFKVGFYMKPTLLTTACQGILGLTIYFVILIITREKIVLDNLNSIIKKLRRQ